MTSIKTQLPYDYYSLPFCKPTSGVTYKAENLGLSLFPAFINTWATLFIT